MLITNTNMTKKIILIVLVLYATICVKSFKMFEDFLKKNKLQLNKMFNCNFSLKSVFQDEQKVNSLSICERDGISPCLIFECYNKDFVGSFGLMNPELIQDKYDKAAIISDFSFLEESKDYDINCFAKIKKFMSVGKKV